MRVTLWLNHSHLNNQKAKITRLVQFKHNQKFSRNANNQGTATVFQHQLRSDSLSHEDM